MSKLDVLINEFNKEYKEQIAAKGISREIIERIPFTSPRANYMLYGGLPRNRLIEFAGEEGSGKTTTALDVVSNAQKLFIEEYNEEIKKLESLDKLKKEDTARLNYLKSRGPKRAVYMDCENTLQEDWAVTLGVDIDEMMIIKPQTQTAEQIFEMALEIIETDEVGILVIDSLAVLISQQAYEKTMEEKTYGGISSALTLFSRKAINLCKKHDCLLIGINQVRENMNSPYGGTTTPGGRAWKHNCSVRIQFRKGSFIDDKGNEIKRSSEEPHGNLVMMDIVKNKVSKPDRKLGFYTLNYDYGIDDVADLVDLAIRYSIIKQAGAWFNFVDTETGEVLTVEDEEIKIQGKSNLINYLHENTSLYEDIYEKINSLIQ